MSRLRAGGESELSLLFFLSRYLCPRAGSSPIVADRVVSALTRTRHTYRAPPHISLKVVCRGRRARAPTIIITRLAGSDPTQPLLSLPTRLYRILLPNLRSATCTSALPLAFARTVRSIACYASLGVALGVRVPTGVATQLSSQLHPAEFTAPPSQPPPQHPLSRPPSRQPSRPPHCPRSRQPSRPPYRPPWRRPWLRPWRPCAPPSP